MSDNKGYNVTAKAAAKALGKSITTIHRYIDKGRLSKVYVNTDHGREVRLRPDEILKLAQKLNEREFNRQAEEDLFSSDNPFIINIREVLSRYERTLYQVGELTEKLENQKAKMDKRIQELEDEKERLQVKLANQECSLDELTQELTRPLTFSERISGRRRPNY